MARPKHKKYTGNKKRAVSARPPAPRSAPAQDAGTAADKRPAAPAVTRSAAPAPKQASTKATPAAKAVDFRSEYRYVLGDLKLLGILAAAMFTTLIVLAVVLR